jgi:hypothetical protein
MTAIIIGRKIIISLVYYTTHTAAEFYNLNKTDPS